MGMSTQSSSSSEESSSHAPLHNRINSGYSPSHKSGGSIKRNSSIDANDSSSAASSSIGWNPEWDEDDHVKESANLPVSSINVALNESIVKEEPLDQHVPSSPERQGDSSSDGSVEMQQLADDAPVRYEMLGAPTLVYRHVPSYRDSSTCPTPLTPSQIEMALYMKDHPLGSWFKGNKRKEADYRETYPHSLQRYLPKTTNAVDSDGTNHPLEQLHNFNREKVREYYDLPMQHTNLAEKRDRLEKERLKWLSWKLYKWEVKEKERKKRAKLLEEYYIERDIKRLVYVWTRSKMRYEDEEDIVARRERRREKRRSEREAENEKNKSANGTFNWEPRARVKSEVDEKLDGLEPPLESPIMDESYSSSSSVSDSTIDSIWSTDLSIDTYYSDEAEFYDWEEQTLTELDYSCGKSSDAQSKKRELLSSWVFDGDPGNETNQHRDTTEHKYSLNDLTEMLEKPQDSTQQEMDPSLDPVLCQDFEVEFKQQQTIGGASSYGNCLAVIRCTCPACLKDVTGKSPSLHNIPSYYLIQPTGDVLSCVTISKIRFPRCTSSSSGSESPTLDMDGRILQICVCGKATATTQSEVCLIVRTATHCCVLIAKPKAIKSNPSGMYDCPEAFTLAERARIDLRTLTNLPSYVPYHVASDSKTSISFFTTPSFAILCADENGNKTNIHHVILNKQPRINSHDISSDLNDISIIEFDPRDRLILWAAARSNKMPEVSERFFKRGLSDGIIVQGITGYGHSLYQIDLRNNSASFIWSPSHDEYLVDGVYSISGIMPDTKQDHLLWISSTSAGKTWALDVRYKRPKVMVSWSLPSLCDDLGAHYGITGIYGAGVLMSQPLPSSTKEDRLPTMFSIKKDTNSATLNSYQFPTSMPRFQTRSLESAGFVDVPKVQHNTTSIARSTTFTLPGDISDSIFNIGIALLELPLSTSLGAKKCSLLGYKRAPSRSVYAFTMTSIGDVFCHTLLACDATEKSKAKFFPGLAVGMTSIPVPNMKGSNKRKQEGIDLGLTVELSNVLPAKEPRYFNSTSIKVENVKRIRTEKSPDKAQNNKAVQRKLPCSFQDLCLEQRAKSDFDTLLLSDDRGLKSTSAQMRKLERQVEVSQAAAGFCALGENSAPSSLSQKAAAVRNKMKLNCKHAMVAFQKKNAIALSPSETNAGDITTDLLERLESNYLRNGVKEEEDTYGLTVKEDKYSDDDMDM